MNNTAWKRIGIVVLFGFLGGLLLSIMHPAAGMFEGLLGRPVLFALPMAFFGAMLAKGVQVARRESSDGQLLKVAGLFAVGGIIASFFATGVGQSSLVGWGLGGAVAGVGMAWAFARTPQGAASLTGFSAVAAALAMTYGHVPALDCPT